MARVKIALKIDVDTYRGIEEGAARLAAFLYGQKIPASFFVSLGPDNSGWAATRVFRHAGFLKKMNRTSAVSVYGVRTALSGTLWPARPMGTSFPSLLRQWRTQGFEVSPHGYDHILWHDEAATWDEARAAQELEKVAAVYRFIFDEDPKSFAAPGWQAGRGTWQAMEKMNLLYHSDSRGDSPYFFSHEGKVSKTLEIPTTLPTWDEMLAWDAMTPEKMAQKTLELLQPDRLNVWTVHAEFEGGPYFDWFKKTVLELQERGEMWEDLRTVAARCLERRDTIPVCSVEQTTRPGRAGTVSCQARLVAQMTAG